MPPRKPKAGKKKYAKVTTIPPSKQPRKSFFEEYYYRILAAEFACITVLVKASGMSLYEATLVGLLVTTFTAVGWQGRQYLNLREGPPVQAPAKPAPAQAKPVPPRAAFPVGPDGKKKYPPSYFPPLMDRKPKR